MRVKNKEIKARRHRKEQKIKEAERALRLQYADKKDGAVKTAAPKPAAKKPAPKKKASE